MSFHAPIAFMCEHPSLGMGHGNNGYFKIMFKNAVLHVISSDGGGWEHVSISLAKSRCPLWEEMCYIKDLFWDKEDCVLQFHPPESQYINNVRNCLHLWRKCNENFILPPQAMIGLRAFNL